MLRKKELFTRNSLISLDMIRINDDGICTIDKAPQPANQQFRLDHLTGHVALVPNPEENTLVCQIWGKLAEMPYTAENREARANAIDILRAAREVKSLRLILDQKQDIIALYDINLSRPLTPDALIYHLYSFVQAVRPFAHLLTRHAGAPQIMS